MPKNLRGAILCRVGIDGAELCLQTAEMARVIEVHKLILAVVLRLYREGTATGQKGE